MSTTIKTRYDYRSNSVAYEYKYTPLTYQPPIHSTTITETTPLTEEQREQIKKDVKRCCMVSNALGYSKCEMAGSGIGIALLVTSAVLKAVSVNEVAGAAVAFSGAGLVLGMFAKRVFINVYHCATRCSNVPDVEAPVENTWKDWCLLGRASPFCCSGNQINNAV